ncbi:hypothetical protein [Sphingomonas sp. MS122]|uniref:hypothetical protein n=1 Tax=Sphingomonas sp. MS122 TaxID=3412683 RepID=UPI003C2C9276
MRKAVSVLVAAAASFAAFSSTAAQANEASVCSGSYQDPQTNTGMYADVGFFVDEWCTDPDGDSVTIHSISWGPGWQYYMGPSAAILWQIGYGPETIPITVTDGQGNYTVFDWVYSRQP